MAFLRLLFIFAALTVSVHPVYPDVVTGYFADNVEKMPLPELGTGYM
ncbi:MAG: hypothetical protein AABY42_06980 [Nitrospirota bacterium]